VNVFLLVMIIIRLFVPASAAGEFISPVADIGQVSGPHRKHIESAL